MRRLLPTGFLILLAAGCATAPPKPVWVAAEATFRVEKGNYAVELPTGWMRWNQEERVTITRDGFSLQIIGVDRHEVGKPLKHAKKRIEREMLPQEISGILIDDRTVMEDVASSEVLENVPAQLGGIDGFRFVLQLRLKNGEVRKFAMCGCRNGDWVYAVTYTAPARYYFQRDLPVFEGVSRSFRFLSPS